MKRTAAAVVTLLLGVLVALIPGSASAHSRPYCGIHWGSLPKAATSMTGGELVNVRAGRHACFDRLVLDVKGGRPGYFVEYVDQVRTDGAGFVVPLRGGAKLQIVSAPAYDEHGLTYRIDGSELVNVKGFRTFRQVAGAGTFEGQSTIGLGVRARLPFRVFTLAGPGDQSRLVIDVAHRW
jgi:hypothetical protein